jgi:hypothetical protein
MGALTLVSCVFLAAVRVRPIARASVPSSHGQDLSAGVRRGRDRLLMCRQAASPALCGTPRPRPSFFPLEPLPRKPHGQE